jgi:hypothetical protein
MLPTIIIELQGEKIGVQLLKIIAVPTRISAFMGVQ